MEKLLDVPEAAAYLRINEYTVRRLAHAGSLPAFKVGKSWRFSPQALEEWARSQRHGIAEKLVALVVDDQEAIRNVVRRALESEEYSVVEAADGDEAIALLDELKADIVFLDLKMPKMTGPEVLKAIREKWGMVPVVIMTAYPDSEMMEQALKHSPITMLAKPFPVERLVDCANALCKTKRTP